MPMNQLNFLETKVRMLNSPSIFVQVPEPYNGREQRKEIIFTMVLLQVKWAQLYRRHEVRKAVRACRFRF